jgi:hypothetical protein
VTVPADESAVPRLRDLLPAIRPALGRFGVGGLLPILTFYALFRLAGPAAGILGGMSVSLLALSVQAWRLKRLDPIVVVPMAVIAINGSAGLLTGSVELYLAAPAVENALWGIALLVSVVVRRPLVGLIARELGLIPAAHARSAVVDRALAQTTLAWAGGAFLKAGVRLWLLQVLPLESFLVAITLFTWAVNAALLVGSFRWPLRALAADR